MKTNSFDFSKKSIYSGLLVGFFVFVSVFLYVLLFRNLADVRPGRQNKEMLIEKIKNLEKERAKLKEEVAVLTGELERLEKTAALADNQIKKKKEELDAFRRESGLTAVEGKGVEIVLRDAEISGATADSEQAVVHDSDIRLIINGLYLGGARAVSVNGERITSLSSIRCVGPTVLINSRRVSSPFVIRAIGDPDELVKGLYRDEVLSYYLTNLFPQIGIGFEVKPKTKVVVPAYKGSLKLPVYSFRVVEK